MLFQDDSFSEMIADSWRSNKPVWTGDSNLIYQWSTGCPRWAEACLFRVGLWMTEEDVVLGDYG